MGGKFQITITEEKVQQNVNLHHVGRQAPQVARKGKIVIDRRRIPVLDWWFVNAAPKEKFKMEIEAQPSPRLTIRDMTKLLQVSLLGEDVSIDGFEIRQNVTSYVVEFYPDEVTDCQIVETCNDGSENSVFPILYKLRLIRLRNNSMVKEIEGQIEVRIEPISRVEPDIVFKVKEEYRNGIFFSGRKQEQIVNVGDLEVRNSGEFFRSPAISLTLALEAQIEGEPIPRLVTLDIGQSSTPPAIVGGRPLLNPNLTVNLNNGNIGARGSCSSCSRLNGKAIVNNLVVEPRQDHYVSFPVYLDMSQMTNPSADVSIAILATTVYRKYYESSDTKNTIVSEAGGIVLKRNTRIMDLEVFAGPDGAVLSDDYRVKNHEEKVLEAEYFAWVSENEDYPSLDYEYIINNSADAGDNQDAAIIIKDLVISPPVLVNGVNVIMKQGKRFPDDMFRIGPFNKNAFLKAGSPYHFIPIKYTDEHLDRIVKTADQNTVEIFNTFVEFKVQFDYCIDKTGLYRESPDDYQFNSFETTLKFRIFKRAKPEWFCLDFGTSAVVASFARSLNGPEDTRLIPLAAKKAERAQKTWPQSPEEWEDAGEGARHLIASSAVLAHDDFAGSFRQPDKYGSAAVLFSPPTGYTEYYYQLLPCLKSLVGNKYLPSKLIPPRTRRINHNRIVVNDILKMIYGQLFRFFIPDNAKETQRMVISFPNTFAMSHIDIIKRIAVESLGQLRDDYLRFISESDAVAFYYNHHRKTFIDNSNLQNPPPDFDRHVLVYDMGAGTLDLTYFVRSRVRTAKDSIKTRISINGKLGMSKAGNYLDYVLANILVKLLCEKDKVKENTDSSLCQKIRELMIIRNAPSTRSLTDAFELKNYVKNTLKPHLDDAETDTLPGELTLFGSPMPLDEITLKEIIEDDEFKDFQEGITKRVFESFVALFGEGDESSRHLPIDLVLFSGRMTGSLSLRKAVKNALAVFGPQDKEVMFADLSARRFVDIDTPVESITGLKTVVIDGALAFSQGKRGFELVNSNVYATYGAFLVSNESEVTWLPLIDYRTKPIAGKEFTTDDGITIKEYNTRYSRANTTSPVHPETVDLANYRSIIIAQTYSKDPLADWNANRRELISVIGRRDLEVPEGASSVQPIRLRIDRNNHLSFSIGNEPQELLPHDDYESDTFARAMWPIVM